MMSLESVYMRLPPLVQDLACSVAGLGVEKRRYGSGFQRAATVAAKTYGIQGNALTDWQRDRVRALLAAAQHSSFWVDRFRRYGVDPLAQDPLTELGKLPVLRKDDFQSRSRDLLTGQAGCHHSLLKSHTSGTTGAGLKFWESRAADHMRWAVWWRYRMRHGIRRGEWCGYFGGRTLISPAETQPPYWRVNRPGRQVMFSAYHLSAETATHYLAEIRKCRVRWLHGYPSVLALLAGYALDHGWRPDGQIRWVTTGAENLLAHQRQLMEEAFGARVCQHYGQAEAVANFSECERGRLHVDEDYALVEFLPIGETGRFRIVGTNLQNLAFPLLRYDTNDVAVMGSGGCACGLPWRVVSSVDGRQEDYLVLADGSKVGRLDHILKDMVTVREAQFRQHSPGEAELVLVPGDGFHDGVEDALRAEVEKRFGHRLSLSVRRVERIDRLSSGKLRFVVSTLAGGRLQDTAPGHGAFA